MVGSKIALYHSLADWYDAIYDWKDYRAEARRLEQIARRYGRTGRTRWLDVACGTGHHLEYLRGNHPCVGVDGSAEMLRIARRRLPGMRLVRGDMRSFDLGARFDVVTCLFSAVGHLPSERDLQRTFSNFARHLAPGGVAIVEPWLEPAAFRPGTIHLRTHQGPSGTIVRLASSARRGNRSVIDYHYLVADPARGLRYFTETDVGLMVPRARLIRLMRRAGLRSRFLTRGFTGDRGLLLGVKPT